MRLACTARCSHTFWIRAPLTYDVMLPAPHVDVDRIEYCQQWEPPGDAVDNDAFALGEELVDDGAKQKEMDEGPSTKYEKRKF